MQDKNLGHKLQLKVDLASETMVLPIGLGFGALTDHLAAREQEGTEVVSLRKRRRKETTRS
jgi:16S rRNA A1518/A1519 N6-dimethyltransferase RsmA/KsgA/DIM1 with predicted DNA glycosylase/AP lyase activity